MICRTNARKYFSAKPYPKVIKKINHLHSRGYYIKVFTARFMGRSNENIRLAKKRGYRLTFNQLKKWNLKFHKLIMGKPSFDLIVDEDASLHEAYDTWREKNMYGKKYMGTLRSTFVISPDGSLKWVKYKVSPKGHVEQLLSDLEVN